MSETKRRRGHHEGSPVHRKDGRWEWRVTMPNGGPRRSFYGRTQKEARDKANAALRDYAEGIDLETRKLTVAAYLEQWLADIAATEKVRPTTLRNYRMYVRVHIVPALGGVRLRDLTPLHVNRLLRSLVDEGMAPSSANQVRQMLGGALSAAMRAGYVSRNVAALSEPRPVKKTRREPLTIEQVHTLLRETRDSRHGPLWHLAIATGARQGELLALRWEDVDLTRAILHIRHTLTRYDGTWHLADPKTEGSRRDVKLTASAVAALERQQIMIAELEMAATNRWQEHGLVFPSILGTPQDGAHVTKAFQKELERLGLPRQRFHDLRHATASLLLAEGIDIFTVKEVLGHSSINLTGDTYGHLTKKLAEEAAMRLERAINADASPVALDAKTDARADLS